MALESILTVSLIIEDTNNRGEYNMASDEDRKYEEASIEAWELAVYYSEIADYTLVEVSRLYWAARKIIEENQTLSAFYLALGGYGEDRAAYEELGLTEEAENIIPSNILDLLEADIGYQEDDDDYEAESEDFYD
jgi:hypothetical protein